MRPALIEQGFGKVLALAVKNHLLNTKIQLAGCLGLYQLAQLPGLSFLPLSHTHQSLVPCLNSPVLLCSFVCADARYKFAKEGIYKVVASVLHIYRESTLVTPKTPHDYALRFIHLLLEEPRSAPILKMESIPQVISNEGMGDS